MSEQNGGVAVGGAAPQVEANNAAEVDNSITRLLKSGEVLGKTQPQELWIDQVERTPQ